MLGVEWLAVSPLAQSSLYWEIIFLKPTSQVNLLIKVHWNVWVGKLCLDGLDLHPLFVGSIFHVLPLYTVYLACRCTSLEGHVYRQFPFSKNNYMCGV